MHTCTYTHAHIPVGKMATRTLWVVLVQAGEKNHTSALLCYITDLVCSETSTHFSLYHQVSDVSKCRKICKMVTHSTIAPCTTQIELEQNVGERALALSRSPSPYLPFCC